MNPQQHLGTTITNITSDITVTARWLLDLLKHWGNKPLKATNIDDFQKNWNIIQAWTTNTFVMWKSVQNNVAFLQTSVGEIWYILKSEGPREEQGYAWNFAIIID